jgi:hypothetical protein
MVGSKDWQLMSLLGELVRDQRVARVKLSSLGQA